MTIQAHFNTFDKKIYLTNHSKGYQEAKAKDEGILSAIKEAFREAGYPIIDTFFQGSFAVYTAINSLDDDFDIDRALVIDASQAPDDPIAPKKVVKKVLENRNFKEPKIKKPCITADYQSLNLHIDYTVYALDSCPLFGDSYKLAVGKEGSDDNNKEWSPSDPKELIGWIDDAEQYGMKSLEKRKQFRRLVRYMKRWRDESFSAEVKKKLFSIGLTVMLKEQYAPGYLRKELEDDLTVLKKVVDNILDASYLEKDFWTDNYRLSVKLPRKPGRDIFQHKVDGGRSEPGSDYNLGNQFRNKLQRLQDKLQKAQNEESEVKQCTLLNSVFGDDFPIPEEKASNAARVAAASVAYLPVAGASGTSQGA
ncbi:nucleotidyltransferase domain-containing protein [Endozoicomonas ascidiicola]|uniref:nucleotidyltransferase domain-containing protein n=1 Tax=Endozoicomonas ascidiicola TaxID=1698521 RepID=UPI0008302338|nr:nucleotidyltransferase [Endozoicomonas ascidiicola]